MGRQFLFSVYTHPAPSFSASPPLCSALPSPPENPLLEIIVWFYDAHLYDWHATVFRDRIIGWVAGPYSGLWRQGVHGDHGTSAAVVSTLALPPLVPQALAREASSVATKSPNGSRCVQLHHICAEASEGFFALGLLVLEPPFWSSFAFGKDERVRPRACSPAGSRSE